MEYAPPPEAEDAAAAAAPLAAATRLAAELERELLPALPLPPLSDLRNAVQCT